MKSAALIVVELPEYFVTITQCSIEPVLTCTIMGYSDSSVLNIDFSDVLSGPVELYPYLVAIVDHIAYSKSMPSFFNVSGGLVDAHCCTDKLFYVPGALGIVVFL